MNHDSVPAIFSARDTAWILAIMRVKLADRLRVRASLEPRSEVAKALRLVAEEFERVGLKELL